MARPPAASNRALSLEAVIEAVAAVMRASNPAGIADQALSARLGALIHPQLAHALRGSTTSGAELVGQQAFRAILSQHLSGSAGAMDDHARRAMQDYLLRHANRTGAEFAALTAQYSRGGGRNGRADARADHDDSTRSDSGSSLRFDETFLRSPAGLEMQAHALRHGLDWAVGRADVLRLGKEAIELFARTRFTGRTFDDLREVGFQGRQIERLVRRAEESGQDANEVGRLTRDSVRIFGGNDAQERQRWVQRFDNFNANPRHPGAWQELDGALGHIEREGTPEQQAQARRQREVSERIRQSTLQLNVGAAQATVVAGQAAVANAHVDQGIEGLNAPPPAAATATSPPATAAPTAPPVAITASAPHP